MDILTLLTLMCAGIVYLICCVLVVRAFLSAKQPRQSRRLAGLWVAAFCVILVGCLALNDVAGIVGAAIFSGGALLIALGVTGVLLRRWEHIEAAAQAAYNEASQLIEREQATTPQPLDTATLCVYLARAYDLTRREEELTVLLLDGCAQAALPDILCVSENTVKTHVRRIYRKLGIHSRQELFDRAEALRHERGSLPAAQPYDAQSAESRS